MSKDLSMCDLSGTHTSAPSGWNTDMPFVQIFNPKQWHLIEGQAGWQRKIWQIASEIGYTQLSGKQRKERLLEAVQHDCRGAEFRVVQLSS